MAEKGGQYQREKAVGIIVFSSFILGFFKALGILLLAEDELGEGVLGQCRVPFLRGQHREAQVKFTESLVGKFASHLEEFVLVESLLLASAVAEGVEAVDVAFAHFAQTAIDRWATGKRVCRFQ